ncbi:MAG: tetratricopeptide repeat protein [Gammaproteobacteria bacterium]|nr:tetratricopeptide repeat protein [Gammaproteobacteria bacterium]
MVADAFVAGSLQQAIYAQRGSYHIIDGPEGEPRAAHPNDIYLFRQTAFEIRPAHPGGLLVSINKLKQLLREEIAFFQGLDGLLVGMDPDMSCKTRSRSIARADHILESDPALRFRVRARFLSTTTGSEWNPQDALELAVAQGATHAAGCYRPLADGVVERIVADIARVVTQEYGSGSEAADNRDTILRSGLPAELARIEVEGDRNAAINLTFQASDYPDLAGLNRTQHILAALSRLMLTRLAPAPLVRSEEEPTEPLDPITAAVEAVVEANSALKRSGTPDREIDLDAIQRQVEWIGGQLSRGEAGRAERAIGELLRRQALRSKASDIVKTLTAVAELARQTGHEALIRRLFWAIDTVGQRDATAQCAYANFLGSIGRHDEALAALDDAIARFPHEAVPRTARAETLRALRRTDEALAALDDTIARFPENVVARNARAETLRALGRTDEALAALDDTIARFPQDVVARTARAETLRSLGRTDEALAALDDTIARFPHDVVPSTARAETLRSFGRTDEALAALDDTIARFPKDVVPPTARAETLRALGRTDEALAALDDTIARFPHEAVPSTARAETLRSLGRPHEALAALDDTIARFPQDVVPCVARAETLRALDRPDEALAALDDTIARFPENVVARNARAETLRSLGRLHEALAALDDTIARFPQDVVPPTARAQTLRALGRPDEALAALDDTIARFPHEAVPRTARAETLRALRRPDEALAALDGTIARFPENVVARNARAETLRSLGRRDEALAALDDTIARFPHEAVPRTARAETLRALRRPDEALAALDDTIARFPENVVVRNARAETLRSLGRPDEALAALQETVSRFPENARVANTYAHHLALRGELERATAVLVARAARRKTLEDWVARHILAMVRLRANSVDEANQILEDGVRECPFFDVRAYFRTARPIAWLAARRVAEAMEELEPLGVDAALSGTQATNVVLLRAHALAETGEGGQASRLIDEVQDKVIDFEAARQQLATALQWRYGLGGNEAVSPESADSLDREIISLEIELENPLRLAA